MTSQSTQSDSPRDREENVQLRMILPDPKVFRSFIANQNVINPSFQSVDLSQGVPQFDHAEYPESGGILRYYKGFKYPEKGLAFPQVIYAMNLVKREMLGWIRFLSKHEILCILFFSKRVLNDFIESYSSLSDLFLGQFYYKDEFYQPFARQIKTFLEIFFENFGVNARSIPLIGATFFEQDNAYRYFVQDLLLETTKEKLYNDFPKEMERLLHIFEEREIYGNYNPKKLEAIVRVIKAVWHYPRFKNATKKAIGSLDWNLFLPDEADKHFFLIRSDHNYFGRTQEDRWREWMEIYHNDPPKLIYARPKERPQ